MARVPILKVTVDGADVTARFAGRLVSLTIVDAMGSESDTVEIVVDDAGRRLPLPRRGAALSAAVGYEDTGLGPERRFEVDGTSLRGWPQSMTITGKAVGGRGTAKERKRRTYEGKTIGELAGDVAGRMGLEPRFDEAAARVVVPFEAQAGEADLAFLGRVAGERADAIVTVKNGKLVVARAGRGETTTGAGIGAVVLATDRRAGATWVKSYEVPEVDQPVYGSAEVAWFDRKTGERKVETVTVPGAEGISEAVFRDPKAATSEAEAKDRAEAAKRRLGRKGKSATFECEGDPFLWAETPVVVVGIGAGVDGAWTVKRVEHQWSAKGASTTVECEPPEEGSPAAKATASGGGSTGTTGATGATGATGGTVPIDTGGSWESGDGPE